MRNEKCETIIDFIILYSVFCILYSVFYLCGAVTPWRLVNGFCAVVFHQRRINKL